MKRILLVLALCFAVDAHAATKIELLDRMIASGRWEVVGTPVKQNAGKRGLSGTATWYNVSTIFKFDSTRAQVQQFLMWVINEGGVDETAYWANSDPTIPAKRNTARDSLHAFFDERGGNISKDGVRNGYILGTIVVPTAHPDTLQQISIKATWNGTRVVWKVIKQ